MASSMTISTRLEPDEVAVLESLAQLTGLDRSTLVKQILRRGMADLRFEAASDAYRKERATLSRAAQIAGVDIWEFVARMADHGLELHYGAEDFEADLARLANGP